MFIQVAEYENAGELRLPHQEESIHQDSIEGSLMDPDEFASYMEVPEEEEVNLFNSASNPEQRVSNG